MSGTGPVRCTLGYLAVSCVVIATLPVGAVASPGVRAVTAPQLEADWLAQVRLRHAPSSTGGKITPQEDAGGACDGIITGQWGFHTEMEDDPWWQIDLQAVRSLDRLRVFNRCGGFEDRAAHLQVWLSSDGGQFDLAYTHDGSRFLGQPDNRPLVVSLAGRSARFLRLQIPGRSYFHLDEVEVWPTDENRNIALGQPATQSSISQWSTRTAAGGTIDWRDVIATTLDRGRRLADLLESMGVATGGQRAEWDLVEQATRQLDPSQDEQTWTAWYFRARRATRALSLANPLLDFDRILFVKRAPSMFPHLSDQYYGWWARGGGGLYVLDDFRTPGATVQCLTPSWPVGNFLRPDLSHDGSRVLFAFSQFDPDMADVRNKRDKNHVPENVFYHLFEMDLTTGECRQLTRGKYDDFDGRYLPTGDILFLSTRKGQFLQTSRTNTQSTLASDLVDSYVRCGGDDYRPVPVFTMHIVSEDGSRMWPASSFETFEYTPSIANDGRVLYCRWDYIDRFNGHFFSLWSSHWDGTNAQLVYGNYTMRPQATMEPRSIPNSNKIVFTASAHHSITGGSLVLLDPSQGNEGESPLTRLTPEVPFPETEENVDSFYANPWPLSEDFYLVSWSNRRLPPHHRAEGDENPVNAQGIYLYDRFGNLELLHRDPQISSMTPIPVRSRLRPPLYASPVQWDGDQAGEFVVQDIYRGLDGVERGEVKRLRIVGVVPKVQPLMNVPSLGVSSEETGKFVLGTVPVEPDGSAYFRVPSGLPVFFQALDEHGFALQTMRSLTYVPPGHTLACIGCHEPRHSAPDLQAPLAVRRSPSRLQPDATGTWPLRFDTLVQPVLDRHCVACHPGDAASPVAASLDLRPEAAWRALIAYADNDLGQLVFERDASLVGDNPARQSKLLRYLKDDPTHQDLPLTADDWQRIVTWMDTYGQTQGAFSAEQEHELQLLRARIGHLLE